MHLFLNIPLMLYFLYICGDALNDTYVDDICGYM